MHKNRVMIIGGAGYVGSEIALRLLQDRCKVFVLDDLSSGKKSKLPLEDENLTFQRCSITDAESVARAVSRFQPNMVFHLAAIHYIPQCIENPDLVIDVNVRGTLNVVNALNTLETKPKLIFASSASVYGAVTSPPQSVSAIPQPCDVYGYSKLLGEHLIASMYDNYIIARLFNVFGEDDPIPHLIPTIAKQLGNDTIELGNPDSERDYIYVKDAARAFVALGNQGNIREIYNIGSGVCYSVKDVCKKLMKLSGSKSKIIFQVSERREVDPKILCADISKIVSDTDWVPSVKLDQGLRTVIDSAAESVIAESSIKIMPKKLSIDDFIAVVSDFDDTIIDNGDPIYGSLHDIARWEALLEVGKENNMDVHSRITSVMIRSAIVNAPHHVSEAAFWWILTESDFIPKHEDYNPDHPLIRILEERKRTKYNQLLVNHAKATPGAQYFFESLHRNGFSDKLAIASSGGKAEILCFLENHNFGHIFHETKIVSREDVTKYKPHPESYLKALDRLGIKEGDAKRVLAFEDDPRGIIAASMAGLTTCALTTIFTKDELLSQPTPPEYIASSFTEYAELMGFKALA